MGQYQKLLSCHKPDHSLACVLYRATMVVNDLKEKVGVGLCVARNWT